MKEYLRKAIQLAGILFCFFLLPVTAQAEEVFGEQTIIAEGISVGNVYVGGMTVAEARTLLEETYDETRNATITVLWDGVSIESSLKQLGLTWGLDEVLETAAKMGHRGSLIQRYKDQKDLRTGLLHLEIVNYLDPGSVAAFVEDEVAWEYDIKAVSATLERTGSSFSVTPHQTGRVTDQPATAAAIQEAFLNSSGEAHITVEAVIEDSQPKFTTESLSAVQNVLGKATTQYRGDTAERTDRCTNVEVATEYINGTLLAPGESVSTSDLMKERIYDNGYRTGGQFVNNQVEDAIGGGVCQVSSTLYNALLKAEMQIDVRRPHSMLVPYVDPSKDAAIATGSKDLVFTNNQEYPVYLAGYTDGYYVTFEIYGKETRPANRKVVYESIVDSRIVSETKYVDDPSLPAGTYSAQEGKNSDEVVSHLEKVVFIDGVETERETMDSDHYQPSFATIRRGTGVTEAATTEAPSPNAETTASSVSQSAASVSETTGEDE